MTRFTSVGIAARAMALCALLAAGTVAGALASADTGSAQQTTTPRPPGSPRTLADPIANADSPVCGDQDGSEPPVPPVQQCPDYTLLGDLRSVTVGASGSVPVRFDLTFREGFLESKLEVYTVDDANGSVNGVLPGQPGYGAAVNTRAQTVFPLGSTAFTPDVTLSFASGQRLAFRFRGSFYSFEAANGSGRDHLLAYRHYTDAWIQLGWDDEWGDEDFQDMVVNVHAPLALPGPPPGQSTGICSGEGTHAVSGSACQHDPVNSLTGAFVTAVTDLRLPGVGVPFAWRRTYTSSDPTVGRLGPGWTDSYATSLLVQGNGDVLLHGDEGQQVYYTRQGDGSFLGAPGARSILRTIAGGYELVRKDQVVYRFDTQGRLLSMRDRNNQGLAFSYHGSGQLQTITDSVGRQITVTFSDGLLSRVTLPDARYVEYSYLSGRLRSVRDARGFVTEYAYDPSGRLKTIVDQNRHTVVDNTYGSNGRVTRQVDAREKVGTFAWNATTQTQTYTDARLKQWKDVYAGNLLVERRDPLGNSTKLEYDPDLNVKKVTNARGYATTMTYDPRGNMLTRTAPAPLSYQEVWTYNARNDPLTYRDRRGNTTDFGYDPAGNLITVTAPDPDDAGPLARPVTTYGRDPAGTGLLTSITDPRGKTTTFSYLNGNLSEIRTQLGHRTTLCHDSAGRLIGLVDPRGTQSCDIPNDYRWNYEYDELDHLRTQTDPLGHITTLVWDPAGNLDTRTDANGHTTDYGHDEANNLNSVTAPDPDGAGPLPAPVTMYAYDDVGNLERRTDANLHETVYGYDDANRLERVTAPDNRVWTYAYDPNGNVREVVDANGNATPTAGDGKTTYGYDELDRLKTIDYADATPDVAFAYDGNDNRTQMTDGQGTETSAYDALDRLTGITRAGTTLSFGYDLLNLTSRTYPGMPVTSYAYDDDERLQAVAWGQNTVGYLYDPAANLTRTTLPAGNAWRENRAYDRAGRLTAISTSKGPQGAEVIELLSSITLTLDPVGNPLERIRSGTLDGTETYTYDDLDRLSGVCFQAGACPGASDPFIRFAYDGVGNRLSEQRPAGTTSYSYNAADELLQAGTTSYTYDRNGNQLSAGARTFAYDLANRVRSTTLGSTTTTYSYDGEGKRLQASTGSQASQKTNFLWDPSFPLPQLVAETDGAGAPLRRYRHGHRPLHVTAGSNVSYFHYDPLGSIVDLTSASGGGGLRWSYGFEPFGTQRSEQQYGTGQPPNLLKFTGEYLDPTGLYHLRARQYDAGSGRFSTTDPVGVPAGIPYGSAYVYVENRPTTMIDPSGRIGIGIAIGAALGGIAGGVQAAATGEDWKGIVVGAAVGAAAGAAAGALPGLTIGRGALLAGVADFTAQSGAQLIDCGRIETSRFNVGSIAGSALGGGIATALGRYVAVQAASAGPRASQVIASAVAFDPGLYPSIGGNLIGQIAMGPSECRRLLVDVGDSGLGRSSK